MDEKAEKLLDSFARTANRSLLHHEDWRRFYVFAIHAHRKALPISGWNVSNRLFAHGFTSDMAAKLSMQFDLFRELLGLYDQHIIS